MVTTLSLFWKYQCSSSIFEPLRRMTAASLPTYSNRVLVHQSSQNNATPSPSCGQASIGTPSTRSSGGLMQSLVLAYIVTHHLTFILNDRPEQHVVISVLGWRRLPSKLTKFT